MKIIKFKFIAALLCLAALLVAQPARAEVGSKSFAMTNSIAAAFTNSAASTVVKIDDRDNAALVLKFAGSTTQTGNLLLTFARSGDNSSWETTPYFTWLVPCNGTTAVVAWTQLANTTIGAAGYVKLISVANTNSTLVATNASLTLIDKRIR